MHFKADARSSRALFKCVVMATRHWRAFLREKREKNEKKLFNLIFGSFYCTLYIINPLVNYNKNKCNNVSNKCNIHRNNY